MFLVLASQAAVLQWLLILLIAQCVNNRRIDSPLASLGDVFSPIKNGVQS